MTEIKIEQIQPEDEEILEVWSRITEDHDLLGVESSCLREGDWRWSVFVSVMEFIRVESLKSEISVAITSGIAAVPGVEQVHHDDRETWVIRGRPEGPTLVRAVAEVVDRFAPKTRAALDSLESGK